MKTLKIIALRVWIGLLRIERSMRLDAMLTTYAASPERLTAEFVRKVLADVDTDIERAHARIETMKEERREPGASPVWPVWLLAGWLVLMVLLALSGCGQAVALDSTDNRVTLQRSGLAVYTDHGTGCQYLRAVGYHGLTPRLDSTGKPMCGQAEKAESPTVWRDA